jgi:hypothetical protein
MEKYHRHQGSVAEGITANFNILLVGAIGRVLMARIFIANAKAPMSSTEAVVRR